MSSSSDIAKPGLGKPLDAYVPFTSAGGLPSAVLELSWKANTLTTRERAMMHVVGAPTDKPGWASKLDDENITAAWRRDVAALVEAGEPPFHRGFSDEMFKCVLVELRTKAALQDKRGFIAVCDGAGAAFKSDTIVPPKLGEDLRGAARALEEDGEPDWHPGSRGQVRDLVHPSLWPLVYGRTRVVRDRELGLADCLSAVGGGEVIPTPEEVAVREPSAADDYRAPPPARLLSRRFQWLPCEVDIREGRAHIASYVNNLHPTHHADMYGVLERVMTAALPMLSAVVDRARKWDAREDKDLQPWNRIQCLTNSRECTVPEICGDGECWSYNMPDELIDEDEDEDVTQRRWFEETHPIEQPDPCSDDEDDDDYEGKRDDEGGFAFPHPHDYKPDMFPDGSRLQFLVKLANIELTPEKPTYDGGSWHIEGQLNEAIVATAIYYYDSNNITHSHLAFRTPADAEEMVMAFSYVQSDHLPLKILYDLDLPSTDTQEEEAEYERQGINPNDRDRTVQDLGSVETREGRLLVFPNVYQHCVSPFELEDKTRPGHRKVLALFMVDPYFPIISTANVPPQQPHWGGDSLRAKLPTELSQMVYDNLDCPYPRSVALKLRDELMEERKALDVVADKAFRHAHWSFCEH